MWCGWPGWSWLGVCVKSVVSVCGVCNRLGGVGRQPVRAESVPPAAELKLVMCAEAQKQLAERREAAGAPCSLPIAGVYPGIYRQADWQQQRDRS